MRTFKNTYKSYRISFLFENVKMHTVSCKVVGSV